MKKKNSLYKKGAALLIAMASAVLTLSGCGQKSAEPKKELNLYTWDDMFSQDFLNDFEAETGIHVNFTNFDYDEEMLAKLQEAKGGGYDIIVANDYILEIIIQEGLAKKLDKAKFSDLGNYNPKMMSQFYDPNNEYTVPLGAGIPLLVYNPALVDIEIDGYEDLWDPGLEDNIALTSNYRVINGIALKIMGESYNTEDIDVIKSAGEKLLTLAPNVRVISDGNAHDFLISGEVAVAYLYTSQVIKALESRNDLKVVYPKEGLGYGIMCGFIPANAPNADAAYTFLTYISQPEIAAKYFESIGYFCTNLAAEDYISEEMKQLIILPSDMEGEMIRNVSLEAEDLHMKVWNEFKNECD